MSQVYSKRQVLRRLFKYTYFIYFVYEINLIFWLLSWSWTIFIFSTYADFWFLYYVLQSKCYEIMLVNLSKPIIIIVKIVCTLVIWIFGKKVIWAYLSSVKKNNCSRKNKIHFGVLGAFQPNGVVLSVESEPYTLKLHSLASHRRFILLGCIIHRFFAYSEILNENQYKLNQCGQIYLGSTT